MLKPLEQFICDTCGEIIKSRNEGIVEWISKTNQTSNNLEIHSHKIVHHFPHSPLTGENRCYQLNDASGQATVQLNNFMNPNNIIARILKPLDIGPLFDKHYSGPAITDFRDYVEIIKRLTIPYYEEARLYWQEAVNDGFLEGKHEISAYSVDTLKAIVNQYGKGDAV